MCQTAGSVLGSDKYQHLLQVLRFYEVCKQVALIVAVYRVHHMGYEFCNRIAPCHFDQDRVSQQLVCEFLDLFGKSR